MILVIHDPLDQRNLGLDIIFASGRVPIDEGSGSCCRYFCPGMCGIPIAAFGLWDNSNSDLLMEAAGARPKSKCTGQACQSHTNQVSLAVDPVLTESIHC